MMMIMMMMNQTNECSKGTVRVTYHHHHHHHHHSHKAAIQILKAHQYRTYTPQREHKTIHVKTTDSMNLHTLSISGNSYRSVVVCLRRLNACLTKGGVRRG